MVTNGYQLVQDFFHPQYGWIRMDSLPRVAALSNPSEEVKSKTAKWSEVPKILQRPSKHGKTHDFPPRKIDQHGPSWAIRPNLFGIQFIALEGVQWIIIDEARLLGGTMAAGKHRRGHPGWSLCVLFSLKTWDQEKPANMSNQTLVSEIGWSNCLRTISDSNR